MTVSLLRNDIPRERDEKRENQQAANELHGSFGVKSEAQPGRHPVVEGKTFFKAIVSQFGEEICIFTT
jgi:hypothetical protein